jgi:hypothetical protein
MSDFLDNLARSVAQPMPRRRALRIVAGAAAGVAFGSLRVPAARAIVCPPPAFHCDCPAANGLFYRWCCAPNEDCKCIPPPNGGAYCKCKPGLQCGSVCCGVGEKCVNQDSGQCCGSDQAPCGTICCDPGAPCADPDIEYCCKKGERACHGKSTVDCCKADESCCNGKCCRPGLRCHKGRCQKCPKHTKECGDTHCCERGESCCNGRCCKKGQHCCYDDHCCDKGTTCCGEGCCDADEHCCGDHCCRDRYDCCGPACCPPGKKCAQQSGKLVCCSPSKIVRAGSYLVCCGPGQIAVNDRCCPADTPNCSECDPPCQGNDYCFDGQCFHTTKFH